MLEILDTTLREGEQKPHVYFTVEEKIEIAKMLDRIDVELLEAGEQCLVRELALRGLGDAKVDHLHHRLVRGERDHPVRRPDVSRGGAPLRAGAGPPFLLTPRPAHRGD